MQRSIYYFQILLLLNRRIIYSKSKNLFKIYLINLFIYKANILQVFLNINLREIKYFIYLFNYKNIMRISQLTSIVPISLITVILLRVMRCCYHYSSNCTHFSDRKTKYWSWSKLLKYTNLKPISSKNLSSYHCKLIATIPIIKANYNLLFSQRIIL